MEKRFEQFLNELTHTILEKYGERIFSLVLYGSFATRKAKQGSDLDMLIQLQDGVPKETAAGINEMLIAIDKKYRLDVSWTLRVPLLRHIHPPIIIFGYREINWESGVFDNPNLRWTIALSVGSKSLFFYSLKNQGRVLYGMNVLDQIQVNIGLLDWLVSYLMYPFYRLGKLTAKPYYYVFIKVRTLPD